MVHNLGQLGIDATVVATQQRGWDEKLVHKLVLDDDEENDDD